MFEDLLGNLEKQQQMMQQKLAEIVVEGNSGDNAVVVQATAELLVKNIKIDPEKVDLSDHEQLEDLVLVAVNEALEAAKKAAAAESGKLFEGLMPPGGLDGLLKP